MTGNFCDLHFELSDLVTQGGQRWVYAHRDYPAFVFKKQKPLAEFRLKNDFKGWSTRKFPSLVNRIVLKEYRAYVDSCLSSAHDLEMLPISKMFGFSHSNIGVVQIAEKVTLDGITIGPTLSELHRAGNMTSEKLALLNEFVRLVLDFDIPTNDVSGQNIVLGKRRGADKFICVDGFGDIHLIPLRTYSRRIRRDTLAQRMQKMSVGLDLTFDKAAFAFRPL